MLFEPTEPLQNPAQLQARLVVVMSLLEAQNSAVDKLRSERDTLRAERDGFRAERDTANAESLPRRRPGSRSCSR